jgi:hypothetical protein
MFVNEMLSIWLYGFVGALTFIGLFIWKGYMKEE